MKMKRALGAISATALAALWSVPAAAAWTLNLREGVTELSREIYGLHMLILWICVAIAVAVFGVMIYSIVTFRKSKGAVPAKFDHNTTAEVVWTVIPVVILVAMAIPAAADAGQDRGHPRLASSPSRSPATSGSGSTTTSTKASRSSRTLAQASNEARQLDSGIDVHDRRELPARRGQPAGRAGQHEGAHARHRRRRHPRLVGAGLRHEEGRDPRLHQRAVVPGRQGRHVPRPVRRALRPRPRLHADRGPRRRARPSTTAWLASAEGCAPGRCSARGTDRSRTTTNANETTTVLVANAE